MSGLRAKLSRLEYAVFDTHTIARTLASADLTTAQVDAITDAVRQAAEHDVAAEPLATRADLAAIRTDLAALEARLTWRFAGAMLAQTIAMLGGMAAIVRFLA